MVQSMSPPVSSKLPDVGTTIFTVMSQLAADCGAINLSQGFPSFDPPEALTDRIAWHLKHGGNQYAPMSGIPELREFSHRFTDDHTHRPHARHDFGLAPGGLSFQPGRLPGIWK